MRGIIKEIARKKRHKEYIWRFILDLRNEIVDEVLLESINGRHINRKSLLLKADLIRKYSRRLKILNI